MTRDRAVSVTLSFVILLAIATTLLVSMVMVTGSLMESQKVHAVQDELTVTGEGLASTLEQADRLNRATEGNASRLEIDRDLPRHVSGTSYRITVNGSAQELTLSTLRPDVVITISVNATTLANQTDTVAGGPVQIGLDGANLVVNST